MLRMKTVSSALLVLPGSVGNSIVFTGTARGGKDLDGEYYGPPNIYSRPVNGDFACVNDIGQNRIITGSHDYNFGEQIDSGEIIIYSRSDSHTIRSKIHVKNTGEITVDNENVSIIVKNDGNFSIDNGSLIFKLKADGEILLDNNESKVNLKSNGEILIENSSAKLKLDPSGDVIINEGVESAVSFSALKTGFEQLKADLNAFMGHVHDGVMLGLSPTPVAVSTPSIASIDSAESSTVKIP